MIFIDQLDDAFLKIQFKPIGDNVKRMKTIPGANYSGDKYWTIPVASVDDFEDVFEGEFIYLTPRHIILNEDPPPPPSLYKKIPKDNPPDLNNKYSLYDYQKFGANFLAYTAKKEGHAFLTDKVGTGKTFQSIAAGKLLEAEGETEYTMVFCKASLKHQWLRDGVQMFTNDDGIVIDGTKAQRRKQYTEAKDTKYKYVILNYELLLHDYDLIQEIIEEKNVNLVIADEAHKITNRKAKMNNALMRLVQPKGNYQGIDYIFYLTATPLSSKIEQIFGLFQIRRPDYFGKFSKFSKNYLKFAYNGRFQDLVGYRNLDELRTNVFPYMLRRTDEEIDMELPDISHLRRTVSMTKLQIELDKKAQQEQEKANIELQAMYKRNAPPEQIEQKEGMVKAFMYVRKAIANTPELLTMSKSGMIRKVFGEDVKDHKDGKKSAKLEELKDLVDEMVTQGNEKLIIFSEFETMVQLLEREVKKMKIGCVTYTGKHNSAEKDKRIQEFKNDPDCKILIATDAAAEGLNLQHAKYMINYDLPWNPDKLDQRIGRIRRGGSNHSKVKVISLLASQSIDTSVYTALKEKQNLFNFIVENTKEQSDELKRVMYDES